LLFYKVIDCSGAEEGKKINIGFYKSNSIYMILRNTVENEYIVIAF